ncbi:Uma2 family endonuclease [Pseudanabaenaceae cyanobacterium LEGE 13415]|nr:Uma2 family endonuclease [Pseudanabaenaceae cyanobacterium LEGE 13415]
MTIFIDSANKIQHSELKALQLGWLLDPMAKRVKIYRQGQAVETLENPATLSGQSVLPGFVLDLSRVFR